MNERNTSLIGFFQKYLTVLPMVSAGYLSCHTALPHLLE